MRALIQRVSEASVTVEADVIGRIGTGLVVLVGISGTDSEEEARYIVNKTKNLRIFNDDDGKFNRSALDIRAELLIVSQFTLYGNTRKGRRPSFADAALPEQAEQLFDRTVELFRETGLRVGTGTFQAHMLVSIRNDGPVTIMLDSDDTRRPRKA
mgnify:CR=1 FL=1